MLPLVKVLKDQTHRCRIVIVDAGGPTHQLPPNVAAMADTYLTTSTNYGGCNRLLALWAVDTQYVWFHDDDFMPGYNAAEHFVAVAREIDKFAVLGQAGRIYGGNKMNMRDIERGTHHVEVDNVVRSYFVNAAVLPDILALRSVIDGPRGIDVLLSCGARVRTGLKTFLIARNRDPQTSVRLYCLPEGQHGLSSDKALHVNQRQMLLDKLTAIGWRSIADGREPNREDN